MYICMNDDVWKERDLNDTYRNEGAHLHSIRRREGKHTRCGSSFMIFFWSMLIFFKIEESLSLFVFFPHTILFIKKNLFFFRLANWLHFARTGQEKKKLRAIRKSNRILYPHVYYFIKKNYNICWTMHENVCAGGDDRYNCTRKILYIKYKKSTHNFIIQFYIFQLHDVVTF